MKLKDQIMDDDDILEVAHKDYIKALRAYEGIKHPIKGKQKDLFQSAINMGIKTSHDRNCCNHRFYDDAWFTADGISMRIDADHPNDIVDSDWAWDEVEKILA